MSKKQQRREARGVARVEREFGGKAGVAAAFADIERELKPRTIKVRVENPKSETITAHPRIVE